MIQLIAIFQNINNLKGMSRVAIVNSQIQADLRVEI